MGWTVAHWKLEWQHLGKQWKAPVEQTSDISDLHQWLTSVWCMLFPNIGRLPLPLRNSACKTHVQNLKNPWGPSAWLFWSSMLGVQRSLAMVRNKKSRDQFGPIYWASFVLGTPETGPWNIFSPFGFMVLDDTWWCLSLFVTCLCRYHLHGLLHHCSFGGKPQGGRLDGRGLWLRLLHLWDTAKKPWRSERLAGEDEEGIWILVPCGFAMQWKRFDSESFDHVFVQSRSSLGRFEVMAQGLLLQWPCHGEQRENVQVQR